MSWQDAHRYRSALRTAEADLDRAGGQLVWRAEHADVFGTPGRLVQALVSQWHIMVQAQVDCDYERDGTWSDQIRELAAAHPGLAAIAGVAPPPAPRSDGPRPAMPRSPAPVLMGAA
jgi:hypothetical protein